MDMVCNLCMFCLFFNPVPLEALSSLWKVHDVFRWSQAMHTLGHHWFRQNLPRVHENSFENYSDVIMGAMASQVTSLTIVYSTVYLSADQKKHQSSVSLAYVRGIHRWSANSPHKWPVTRKMFPFDDFIMYYKMPTILFGTPCDM